MELLRLKSLEEEPLGVATRTSEAGRCLAGAGVPEESALGLGLWVLEKLQSETNRHHWNKLSLLCWRRLTRVMLAGTGNQNKNSKQTGKCNLVLLAFQFPSTAPYGWILTEHPLAKGEMRSAEPQPWHRKRRRVPLSCLENINKNLAISNIQTVPIFSLWLYFFFSLFESRSK